MGPTDLLDLVEASHRVERARTNDQLEARDEVAGPTEDATGYPDAVCALM